MNELTELARQWRIAHGAAIINRWKFSRHLLRFVESHPDVSYVEIGRACGMIVKDEPYSDAWAIRHAQAARAFPKEPANDDQRSEFNRIVHGYTRKKLTAKQTMQKPERLIAVGIGALKRAVQNGAAVDDVIRQVESELRGAAKSKLAA